MQIIGLILSIIGVAAIIVTLSFKHIVNFYVTSIMGKELPVLTTEPELGKWYSVDVDGSVSSDGSKWQGYFRKGKENKVILYFYGGGFSVNEFTAARPLDVESGFYNDKLNPGLNVMTYAIKEWGIGNSDENNAFRDWTFIGVPYTTGDFHAGSGSQEYIALDGSLKTIYYEGYDNYRKLIEKLLPYMDSSPEQLLITGSSAGGFGASILADDVIELFNNPKDTTVHVDSSLLITENWHDIMVKEWNSPKQLSDVVSGDNIVLDSLVSLKKKREDVTILFDCSVRDYNLSLAQKFFDSGLNSALPEKIGKTEGDRFQQLLKKMVMDMQEKIPDSGIYIWDEVSQKDGHLTVHTVTGTKLYFDKRGEDPSIAQWLQDGVAGNVKSYGLKLLDQ